MPEKPLPWMDTVSPLWTTSTLSQVMAGARDAGMRVRVAVLEERERAVGEHDAPAEGVVGTIALDHGDLVRRVLLLHQDCEEEARRSPAQHGDLHRAVRS